MTTNNDIELNQQIEFYWSTIRHSNRMEAVAALKELINAWAAKQAVEAVETKMEELNRMKISNALDEINKVGTRHYNRRKQREHRLKELRGDT